MQQYGAKLHPDLKFRISRSLPLIDHTVISNPAVAKSFCSILRNSGEVYPTLKLMHELGVLGRTFRNLANSPAADHTNTIIATLPTNMS